MNSQDPSPTKQADSVTAEDPHVFIGQTLNNRFVIQHFLGQGAMGLVFQAIDLRKSELGEVNSTIALKILSARFRDESTFLALLQQETNRAQQLSHPNVVRVYDFDRHENITYMTMELLTGRTLRQKIDQNHMPESFELRLRWCQQLIDVLFYAHNQGIVHGDIKPSNIFIDTNNNLKLIDFSISSDASQNTAHLVQGCTPLYALPETLHNQGLADVLDDIYALGCVLHLILQGDHPYDGHLTLGLKANQAEHSLKQKLNQFQKSNPQYLRYYKAILPLIRLPMLERLPAHKTNDRVDFAFQLMTRIKNQYKKNKASSWLALSSISAIALVVGMCLFGFLSPIRLMSEEIHTNQLYKVESKLKNGQLAVALKSMHALQRQDSAIIWPQSLIQLISDALKLNQSATFDWQQATFNPQYSLKLVKQARRLIPDSNLIASIETDQVNRIKRLGSIIAASLQKILTTPFLSTDLELEQINFDQITRLTSSLQQVSKDKFLIIAPQLMAFQFNAIKQAFFSGNTQLAQRIYQSMQTYPSGLLEEFGLNQWDFTKLQASYQANQAQLSNVKLKPKLNSHDFIVKPTTADLELSVLLESIFGHSNNKPINNLTQQPAYPNIKKFVLNTTQLKHTTRAAHIWQSTHVQPKGPDSCSLKYRQRTTPQELALAQQWQCQDTYDDKFYGPELISLLIKPSESNESPNRLGVARYETSFADIADFCQHQQFNKQCQQTYLKHHSLVIGWSVPQIHNFINYVSEQTGFRYRLMTSAEWKYLADPLGFYNRFFKAGMLQECAPTYSQRDSQIHANFQVKGGKRDQRGIYNLISQISEVIQGQEHLYITPGTLSQTNHCQYDVKAIDLNNVGFRLVREVSQE